MRLTRKQAILLSIDLWTWLADTGSMHKWEWPGWKDNGGQYEHAIGYCFLCEYSERQIKRNNTTTCEACSYYQRYGYCSQFSETSPYHKWASTIIIELLKGYAQQCVVRLKELL